MRFVIGFDDSGQRMVEAAWNRVGEHGKVYEGFNFMAQTEELQKSINFVKKELDRIGRDPRAKQMGVQVWERQEVGKSNCT